MDTFRTTIIAWGKNNQFQLGPCRKESILQPIFWQFPAKVQQISCGNEHTLFLTNTGIVFSLGSNTEGQLGIGNSVKFSNVPICIKFKKDNWINQIKCGWNHNLALSADQNLFSWGAGYNGALGHGNKRSYNKPTRILFNVEAKIIDFSAGSRHSMSILRYNHRNYLYSWGTNESGQLGSGDCNTKLYPIQILLDEQPIRVQCGSSHSLLLTESRLLACGNNREGQLGCSSIQFSLSFVCVEGLQGVCIADIQCGYFSSVLDQRGRVWIWGTGNFGKLIRPALLDSVQESIVKISIQGNLMACVNEYKEVYMLGSNLEGELGIGNKRCCKEICRVENVDGLETIECGVNFVVGFTYDYIDQTLNNSEYQQFYQKQIAPLHKQEKKVACQSFKNEEMELIQKNQELIDSINSQRIDRTNNNQKLQQHLSALQGQLNKLQIDNQHLKGQFKLRQMQSQNPLLNEILDRQQALHMQIKRKLEILKLEQEKNQQLITLIESKHFLRKGSTG